MLHIVAIVIFLKFGSDHPIPLLDIILRFPTAVHCSANKAFNSGCQTLCALPSTCSAAPLFHIFLCTSTIQPYWFFSFFFFVQLSHTNSYFFPQSRLFPLCRTLCLPLWYYSNQFRCQLFRKAFSEIDVPPKCFCDILLLFHHRTYCSPLQFPIDFSIPPTTL